MFSTGAETIRELVFGRSSDGKQVKKFEGMLARIREGDEETRAFAASYAAVNGWGYRASKDQADQPDTLARVLLSTTDATTRGRLAGAYRAAKADLLPRDAALLKKILRHADPNVFTPALRYNLRYAEKRSKDLVGLLREILTAPAAPMRMDALRALAGWGEPVKVFADELEAVARGRKSLKATTPERLVALQTLLKAKAPSSADLVLATVGSVPSAVALEYAVEQRLHAIVPAIIQAARAGEIAPTPTHLAALSLLTRRFPSGEFKQFDDWWRSIEKAKRGKDMVASGFVDAGESAEARRLIEKLGSDVYRERADAQTKLAAMGTQALPALMAATRHDDPAVATAADELVARAEETFRSHRNALAAAAKAERRSAKPLLNPPRPVPARPGFGGPIQVRKVAK